MVIDPAGTCTMRQDRQRKGYWSIERYLNLTEVYLKQYLPGPRFAANTIVTPSCWYDRRDDRLEKLAIKSVSCFFTIYITHLIDVKVSKMSISVLIAPTGFVRLQFSAIISLYLSVFMISIHVIDKALYVFFLPPLLARKSAI